MIISQFLHEVYRLSFVNKDTNCTIFRPILTGNGIEGLHLREKSLATLTNKYQRSKFQFDFIDINVKGIRMLMQS